MVEPMRKRQMGGGSEEASRPCNLLDSRRVETHRDVGLATIQRAGSTKVLQERLHASHCVVSVMNKSEQIKKSV